MIRARRLSVATLTLTGLTAGLLALVSPASPAAAIPKPTPVPVTTAAEVIAAGNNRDRLDEIVGQLSAQVAQAQIAATQARARYQLSEQKVALAKTREAAATAAAAQARKVVTAANAKAAVARNASVEYLQATYYGERVDGTAGSLLTADNPNEVLEQSTLQRYQADNKAQAVAQFQTAQITKSNAEARARAADVKAKAATKTANAAVKVAQADYLTQQSNETNLTNQKANQSQLLALAQNTLNAKQNARANYLSYQSQVAAYKAQQLRIAKAKAEALRLARERAEQAERERRAREKARNNGGGGSSSGGSSSGGGSSSSGGGGSSSGSGSGLPKPGGGSWTPSKGRKAAKRALSLLGDLYIFAGGNKYGPTDGYCTDPIAPCGTLGYDCSGLVLYGWYANWDHYAATQYSQAGSYHPSSDDFMPGDLLFWSENGTQGGIGHVAMYIGHGDVVQAPQSGDVVKITPWDQVESGYYGATRPLT